MNFLILSFTILYTFSLAQAQNYGFKCGKTMYYTCGSPPTSCVPDGVHTTSRGLPSQCEQLIAEVSSISAKTFNYKCPNKKVLSAVVIDGVRYDSNTLEGEECGIPNAGGGGETHFHTFDGTEYRFKGECDLVMAHTAEFGPDKVNLDLHIRTESMGIWTSISNTALRIGNDVLEFDSFGSHFINGVTTELPYALAGKYTVTKELISFKKIAKRGFAAMADRLDLVVDLGHDENIKMTLVSGMIHVRVNAHLQNSKGMLGTQGKHGLVGRDGTLLEDPSEMGFQWQVRDTEAKLFMEVDRFPQYPQYCVPPTESDSFSTSAVERHQAEEACKHVNVFVRRFCIEDVLSNGNVSAAKGYAKGEEF